MVTNSGTNSHTNVHTMYDNRNTNAIQEDYEVLIDRNDDGKVRDWTGKKKRSLLMADHFDAGGLDKKAERMNECANTLVFKKDNTRLRLFQTWFCKVRLCPMCNWRRSLKIAFQNKKVIEKANETEKLRWLFLTLTVRNVEAHELKSTIEGMTQGFNRLFKYKQVQKSVKGYFRALEVTKNTNPDSDHFGTYHPHFHVLIAVKPSYFKSGYYIKQADWGELWKKAAKLDYSPIVHITTVKPKKQLLDIDGIAQEVQSSIAESKAVFEVSKYPVKDSDIIGMKEVVTPEAVETVLTLDNALSHKRLISYGGILKTIHAQLNLDNGEDGDLIKVGEDDPDDIANAAFEVMAYWHVGLKQYMVKN